jgi:hypothetical protein
MVSIQVKIASLARDDEGKNSNSPLRGTSVAAVTLVPIPSLLNPQPVPLPGREGDATVVVTGTVVTKGVSRTAIHRLLRTSQ